MDAPRSSSNGFLTIVCVGILALCGYKLYHDKQEKDRQSNQPVPIKSARKVPETMITVSQLIEPHYVELFSDLNRNNPVDLVPLLTISKERILDFRARSNEPKQAVFDHAAKLLDGMIVAAEERTQALESVLKTAARSRSTLDAPQATVTSNDLFLGTQTKRLVESLQRKKPALDTQFAALRTAEREWNSKLPPHAWADKYNIPNWPSAIITVEADARNNPLEKKAYDQRRSVYSWRQDYYDRYGYPRATQSY
ncbi:MAG TPA: hypothetical protein VFG14_18460 [Chthoniobacteraceae bacterium]|jgi:hypothetical protein|nr:hypothetical protein [Chthoniobacteraceae bacterium]